jgi:hypothetical protein
MRLSGARLWLGLLAAWLALAGIVAAPAGATARMVAMAATSDAPICGEHPGSPSSDHQPMTECALCICCAPLLAVLSAPPLPPPPIRVVRAIVTHAPPARASPAVVPTAAYPRGPPILA